MKKNDAVERDDVGVDETIRKEEGGVDKVEKLELESVVEDEAVGSSVSAGDGFR